MGESSSVMIASARPGHRCLQIDGIDVPESSPSEAGAWSYPACERRPTP
jgi:hypothetical protein